jgi:hypothetical protein
MVDARGQVKDGGSAQRCTLDLLLPVFGAQAQRAAPPTDARRESAADES